MAAGECGKRGKEAVAGGPGGKRALPRGQRVPGLNTDPLGPSGFDLAQHSPTTRPSVERMINDL